MIPKNYTIAFIIVCVMAITAIKINAEQEKREEQEMRVVNISVEVTEDQYMALKRRAARTGRGTDSWTVNDEISYTASAAVALQAADEMRREQEAIRKTQITDDFITDDTPIRVVAAQKEEPQTLSEDPEGEPDAGTDGFITQENEHAHGMIVTKEERDLFLRCIQAEAGNQPIEGKQAAAEVILNRVWDERFPKTITEVIMQPGQFGVVSNGSINNVTPDASTVREVDAAIDGSSVLQGNYVFFNNEPIGRDVIKIGDHYFGR